MVALKRKLKKIMTSKLAVAALSALTASMATFGIMKSSDQRQNMDSVYNKFKNLIGTPQVWRVDGTEGAFEGQWDRKGNVDTATLKRADGSTIEMVRNSKGFWTAKVDDGSGYPLIYDQNADGGWDARDSANGIATIKRNIGMRRSQYGD